MLETVTLDQLRAFLAVCEAGSFSAAARRLRRAQSAVSHAVMLLERALALRLFDRSGRLPALTTAGRSLANDARAVIARADELKARARSIADKVEPELSIAVDAFLPNAALIAALRELGREFPLMPVTLYTEVLGAVESRVRSGQSSLGIAALVGPLAAGADLERRLLTYVDMVSVAAPQHPLARLAGPIPTAALQRHTQLVLTDRSALTEGHTGGVLAEHVWRFADLAARHQFLLAGMGWGNMPCHMVAADIARGRLRPIEVAAWAGEPLRLPLGLIHPRGQPPGPAARRLLEHLAAALAQLPSMRRQRRNKPRRDSSSPPARSALASSAQAQRRTRR